MRNVMATPSSSAPTDAYAPGLDHYASRHRRDAVKTLWEEPVTFSILQAALSQVPKSTSLSVMDIGCGAGEGLHLLRALHATRALTELPRITYRGLDLDEGLLRLAARTHHEEDDAEFWHGDIRADLPEDHFDLYLSCGVPYSHLTAEELQAALTQVFAAVRRNRTRSVLVVDVLGRYSLEWVSRWDRARWPYRMSFFQSSQEARDVPMTFWDAGGLRDCIRQAARNAGGRIARQQLFDRSIMVGRHTATGQFNSRLAPYRTLVNLLEDGAAVALDDLRAPAVPEQAPPVQRAFFSQLFTQWNDVLDAAGASDRVRRLPAAVGGPMVARGLRAVEHRLSPGLGVGHSLSAVVTIDERA
ncbi:class I SAM-dependent methyltransferase [Streptomyces sp. NRRL B-1347]|uniref:class I SAM-dependent methyltransferase n=1 Tax=Streptomyces sp. NRRL B-1347 TaxID=1476877 RepID=UPI0004C5A7D3|nr:class I SAM-dependent methyltransferase [Streptomyces sp. NRRL B-1347]